MKSLPIILLFSIVLFLLVNVSQGLEKLDRGVIALTRNDGNVYIGWRLLASDPSDISFDVLRCSEPMGEYEKVNNSLIKDSCNFTDTNPEDKNWYYVIHPVSDEIKLSDSIPVKSGAADTAEGCLKIKLRGNYGANKIGIADIDPNNPGMEVYGMERDGRICWLYSAQGKLLTSNEDLGRHGPRSFYWLDGLIKVRVPFSYRSGTFPILKYKNTQLGEIQGQPIAIADCLGD